MNNMTTDQREFSALLTAPKLLSEIKASDAFELLSRDLKNGIRFALSHYPSEKVLREAKPAIRAASLLRNGDGT